MSNTKIYAYLKDKDFDLERLSNEIKASPVSGIIDSPKAYSGKILIEFPESLTIDEETYLNDIITAHNGTLKSRTSKDLQDKRELLFSVIVDLSHNHPIMKNDPDSITGYLTSIDNWVNAWKRDGNHTQIISKIIQDSGDTEGEFYDFLNQIVNTEGNKAFEFLIGDIPQTPYI